MINRELIRIKVVQLTYAYYQNGNKNIEAAEKELVFSLSKAYDLYNYLRALTACSRLCHLQVAARFACDADFMETQKKTWNDEPEFLRKLYTLISESQLYKDYMDDKEDSYDADREFWRKLYRTLIQNNADLDALLEEQSLYWNDDKEVVDTFVLKTIKRFEEKNQARQELLPEYDNEEDKEYARKLFRATIMNADEYQRYMSETSRNWDFSRLAYMDIVIMQIALAEMLTFPSIPITVTINEYVEISKLYSTPRSGSYINGMLDTIARHLVATGRLLKHIDEKKQQG